MAAITILRVQMLARGALAHEFRTTSYDGQIPAGRQMIDLHSHILPGIDDGAADLQTALAMARASVANGVSILACTPHIMPGVWDNSGPDIRKRIQLLQSELDSNNIPLHLVSGADVHIAPDILSEIRSGRILTLHDSRYILIEVPHHVAPPRLDDFCFSLLTAGYVPVFTHPERLSWIHTHYELFERLARSGVWMQITAGSLTGGFGKRAKHWAEKMLRDGLVHILATDTHNVINRPPILAEGWEIARSIVGDREAEHLVVTRPYGILRNEFPSNLPSPPLEDIGNADFNSTKFSRSAPRRSHGWSRELRESGDGGRGVVSRWMRRLFDGDGR